jgi:hypothetical protein
MAMEHLGRRLVGIGVSVGALLLGSAAVAHAEPPSGRDNVTIWGTCTPGKLASVELNIDDYQRNSSTRLDDASGYLDNAVITSGIPINRTWTNWAAVKKDGRVVSGSTWKVKQQVYGAFKYQIDPDQGQVTTFVLTVHFVSGGQCSVTLNVGDAK